MEKWRNIREKNQMKNVFFLYAYMMKEKTKNKYRIDLKSVYG